MKKATFSVLFSIVIYIVLFSESTGFAVTLVDSPINNALSKIFPELKQGYIDLNNNNQMDQSDEIDERIAETVIKDSQLQGKEILDFIINYYMFLPLDKVRKVKEILDNPKGAISEIVALRYRIKIYEIEQRRSEMEESGERVITSLQKQQTEERLRELISIMINSYKKEGNASEKALIEARAEFLKVVNDGNPVPLDLREESKEILTSILINRVLKNGGSKNEVPEVITSIEAIGQLKRETAVDYLMDLLSNKSYKIHAIRALGNIGNPQASDRLLRELEREQDPEIKIEIIRALGKAGNEKVVMKLKGMFNNEEEMLTVELKKEVFLALSKASKKHADPTLVPVFNNYLSSNDPFYRMVAIRGLANLNAFRAANELNNILQKETDPIIQLELIRALSILKYPNYIVSFTVLLKRKNIDPEVRKAILDLLAKEKRTELVINHIILNIGHPDPEVRETAKEAILKQSKINLRLVASSLNNVLVRSKDKTVLVMGSEILSKLKDPLSAPTFLFLTKSEYTAVRENATWGIYRIGRIENINLVVELVKIATDESQPTSVRTNAIRALGAIGYSDARVNTIGTLINIIKLQDEKYIIMKKFAIQALGEIGRTNDKVLNILTKTLLSSSNLAIKLETVSTLNKIGDDSETVVRTLKKQFNQTEESALQIEILRAMGDIGTVEGVDLARVYLEKGNRSNEDKIEILYILSRIGKTECINPILKIAMEPPLKTYALTVLGDFDPDVIVPVLKDKRRSESDNKVLEIINSVLYRLEEDL
ncbi:MAG TPA: HEAT repeat domain-containing protein [Spirochaetes bacterium]|nr:HEAT repeat domain-containing protein [Spirochaetota bacterium]